MKNSVLFKFIAIALCAVSLLGILASGLGLIVMTENDLFDRTVDEMIDERIRQSGETLSWSIAMRYASENLGGCPYRLADHQFPLHLGFLNSFGYTLTDAEGAILAESKLPEGQADTSYTFPVTGQYIYLVDLMPREEKYPSRDVEPTFAYNEIREGETYLYDAIPREGAMISQIMFTLEDGYTQDYYDENIGVVHYDANGSLVCLLGNLDLSLPMHIPLTEIVLLDIHGNLLYQATDPQSVGYFTESDNGVLMFIPAPEAAAEPDVTWPMTETTAAVTEETIAPTSEPETVPETTVPETTEPETVPETTEEEALFALTDNIPRDSSAEVIHVKATFRNGEIYEHSDWGGFGRIRYNDSGTVVFTSYDNHHEFSDNRTVIAITFLNRDSNVILEASCLDGVGKLYLTEDGQLAFRSNFPERKASAENVPSSASAPPQETIAVANSDATEPLMINGKHIDEYGIDNTTYYDHSTDTEMYAEFVYVPLPEYTVTLHLDSRDSVYGAETYEIFQLVWAFRRQLLPLLGLSILIFVIFAVYLCCAAGRKPKSEEVRAGGLNRIPLDLYLCLTGFGITGLVVAAAEGGNYLLRKDMTMGIACALGCSLAACLLAVGFLFAFVAQIKTSGGYWWRNTLCGHFFRWFLRFGSWLERFLSKKFFLWLGRMIKWMWKTCCALCIWTYRSVEKAMLWIGRTIGRIFSWMGRLLHRFLSLLPLTWQWLLMGFFLVIVLILGVDGFKDGNDLALPVSLLLSFALVFYAAHCFGLLAESTRRMSKGDLDTKVDDKLMLGCFKDSAADLNALADVAVIAAQKQLKSERMKTELITNVSHDIKTPLTSIINYVDLLQKPHTEEEQQQYLEVLDRQSQRLKKLIEDLMDMSKANTGNMAVEITQVDAVEAVTQAIGEFADKLERAQLVPVFRHTEESAPMMADGRLVWRVMSNLLGNAVKYAMPGTRVYIDVIKLESKVVISLKNISREELTVDADELMERFVRGDDSRNTEGSGLGLNIAKSLMDLQKGHLQLLVDGDLFKVTLIFPSA